MDNNWIEITGGILAIGGSIFLFLGSLGLLRMPDAYNRIQTGTKASTLGTILSLAGLFFFFPGWFGKFMILILFVLITNPISSHVLARAAYFTGVPLTRKTTVDQLNESLNEDPSRRAHLRKVSTNTEEDKI
ncbi:MAG: monovalent cation/H(+) antiporter subunit G [Bacteroidales bacterium]|nr:monovalent cation/H(+) antiporter subunit G [Bacteroidales bacterium]